MSTQIKLPLVRWYSQISVLVLHSNPFKYKYRYLKIMVKISALVLHSNPLNYILILEN